MLTSVTGPRVPFENYPVYIGGGRVGGFYDADLALLLIFLQQGTLTHSKLTQYRPLVRVFSFSLKSKINLLLKVFKNLPATSERKIAGECLKQFKTAATSENGNSPKFTQSCHCSRHNEAVSTN